MLHQQKPLQSDDSNGTRKRRLDETEDSIPLSLLRKDNATSKKSLKTHHHQTVISTDPRHQRDEEQAILNTFRKNNAKKFEALSTRCATPEKREEKSAQPLYEEFEAVNELINCIQADLAQTTFLVTYIKDFVRKNCKRRIPLQTLS
ncbi:uncharacterized protein LOC130049514 [Ostrea edulis]|uniref:uncharacterized protein LOC130049514 n=1 Tax=Ostrea edulis TaxID=37623 RepID=UPI0024AF23E1|nr:uncharacterized protein LOC130049514 [Ostrea edulis]